MFCFSPLQLPHHFPSRWSVVPALPQQRSSAQPKRLGKLSWRHLLSSMVQEVAASILKQHDWLPPTISTTYLPHNWRLSNMKVKISKPHPKDEQAAFGPLQGDDSAELPGPVTPELILLTSCSPESFWGMRCQRWFRELRQQIQGCEESSRIFFLVVECPVSFTAAGFSMTRHCCNKWGKTRWHNLQIPHCTHSIILLSVIIVGNLDFDFLQFFGNKRSRCSRNSWSLIQDDSMNPWSTAFHHSLPFNRIAETVTVTIETLYPGKNNPHLFCFHLGVAGVVPGCFTICFFLQFCRWLYYSTHQKGTPIPQDIHKTSLN